MQPKQPLPAMREGAIFENGEQFDLHRRSEHVVDAAEYYRGREVNDLTKEALGAAAAGGDEVVQTPEINEAERIATYVLRTGTNLDAFRKLQIEEGGAASGAPRAA